MSTESKECTYTPGPWYFNDEQTTEGGHYIPARIFSEADPDNPKFVAELAVRANYEANARLIAAAPDLLKSLEQLVNLCNANVLSPYPNKWGESTRTAVTDGVGAILKAKGGL